MAESLEQQIAMCQRRMATIAGLIEEERAPGSTPRTPNACWLSRRVFYKCCRICWSRAAPRAEGQRARLSPGFAQPRFPALTLMGRTPNPQSAPAEDQSSYLNETLRRTR
jgi:hypothetical protein